MEKFRRALLATHHISRDPRRVATRDLESVTPSSESTQSSSTSTGDIEFGYRMFGEGKGRDKRKEKRKDTEKAWKMTGGRISERLTASPREITATNGSAEQQRDKTDVPLKDNREPDRSKSKPCPSAQPAPAEGRWSSNVDNTGISSDTPGGEWGKAEATPAESQGKWGGNTTNGDASSGW